MLTPVKVGTTKTINATTTMTCYRIAIGITKPSGSVSWTEYTSTGQVSRGYTFDTRGLYAVTIRVRDISDSNANSNTATHIF